jgi:hypothetical protein
MNRKANIMATAAILTAVALPGIASAQHESQSSAANNATHHRFSHPIRPYGSPRNGAGEPVDQRGIPLPGYSLGPTYEGSRVRLPKKSRSTDSRRPRGST